MSRKTKRESIPQPSGGRYGGLKKTDGNPSLDMFEADGELLRDCVANVVLSGDCIMFALTSDQGALMIRVISGGVQDVFYPATTEAVEMTLQGIRDTAKQ